MVGPELRRARVVVTGASGLIGFPSRWRWPAENDVTAVARFREKQTAHALATAGASVVPWDLADPRSRRPAREGRRRRPSRCRDHRRRPAREPGPPRSRTTCGQRVASCRATAALASSTPARVPPTRSRGTHAEGGRRLRRAQRARLRREQDRSRAAGHLPRRGVEHGGGHPRIFSAYGRRGGAPTAHVDQVAHESSGQALRRDPEPLLPPSSRPTTSRSSPPPAIWRPPPRRR